MRVRYKREMRHNYLILEALEPDAESFEIRMLTGNSIEGLLKFRMKQEEQNQYYYYEITSKQPLSRLLEFKAIRKEDLGRLIIGIGSALHHMEDFLLQESHVLLGPEHIYIEPETYQVWLCYVPGYQGDFPAAMEKLLQYLLKKADHRDNDTVVLAYRLYQESQKDYYGMEDLLRAVQESQCSTHQKEPHPDPVTEEAEVGIDQQSEKSLGSGRERKNQRREEQFERYKNRETVPEKEREKGREKKIERQVGKKEKSQRQTLEIQKNGRKNQGKIEEESQNMHRKNSVSSRKGTMFAAVFLLAFLTLIPAVMWLFLGQNGFLLYGRWIAAADIGAVAGFFIFLLGKRKQCRMRSERIEQKSEEDWYMTFEETEEEEIKREAARQDGIQREETRWDRPKIHQNTGVGREAKGQLKRETEAEPESETESETAAANSAAISKQELEPGRNTVLLATADTFAAQSHLLKSLDPVIEDISIPYFPFLIGKQEGIVDYVLKKDTVSRLHIRIDEEEGGCQVTDLNSSNGTIVAGHHLEANESCLISSGDKLQIADIPFIFY